MRARIKNFFTESFLPFAIILIALVIFLQYMDQRIESAETTIMVRLNSESGEEEPLLHVSRTIPVSVAQTPELKTTIEEINAVIEVGAFKNAKKLILKLSGPIASQKDVLLSLAYLHYKLGEMDLAKKILMSDALKDDVRSYYSLGLVYGASPDTYQNALEYYRKFLDQNERSYEAAMNIALIYYRLAQNEQSYEFYEKASNMAQGARRARALYMMGKLKIRMNDRGMALDLFQQGIRLDPGNYRLRVAQAEALIESKEKKQIETGLQQMKEIINLDENDETPYYHLGRYYMESGSYGQAISWFKAGRKIAPHSRLIVSSLGFAYLRAEEYMTASSIYQKLINEYPEEKIYHFNMARAQTGLENYEDAFAAYRQALAIDPRYYEALLNMGVLYAKLDNYEEAVRYYDKALRINPDAASVYYNIGVLYRKMERPDKASEYFHQAIQKRPDYPEAYFNLAINSADQDKSKSAEKYYLKAIEIDPKYDSAYYNLARLYEREERYGDAVSLLETGSQKTSSTKLITRMAYNQYKLNRFEESYQTYRQALEKDAEERLALLGISRVSLVLNKYDESRKTIEKYLYQTPKSAEGRYIHMRALAHLDLIEEARQEWQVLQRIEPGFEDSDAIAEKFGLNLDPAQ